jgi:hypothetical protein
VNDPACREHAHSLAFFGFRVGNIITAGNIITVGNIITAGKETRSRVVYGASHRAGKLGETGPPWPSIGSLVLDRKFSNR